jgi:hypothetical protein
MGQLPGVVTPKVTEQMNDSLTKEFVEEDVKKALF